MRTAVLLCFALLLTLGAVATPGPLYAQDGDTAAPPPDTVPGTAADDLLARYHPDLPNVCRIEARENVLAVGQDLERELVRVFAGGAGCEGRVWVSAESAINWAADLDRVPVLDTVPPRDALTEFDTYDALCATDPTASATRTASEVSAVYTPGGFSWLPPQFVPTAEDSADAVLCLQREFVSLGICPGVQARVERFREATTVSLIEVSSGGLIARERFDGPFPVACPSAVTEDASLYGPPVPREAWAAWLIGRLRLVSSDTLRTTTLVPRLNARAESNTRSEILDILPEGTPVNLIARNESGTWYVALLPDMQRAWLFAEFVGVAAQTPLEALPVVSGPASEVAVLR